MAAFIGTGPVLRDTVTLDQRASWVDRTALYVREYYALKPSAGAEYYALKPSAGAACGMARSPLAAAGSGLTDSRQAF